MSARLGTTSERDLVERLRRAEPGAFDQLYDAEKATVYGFLLRLSRDAHVAADLFQNVWLKLAQNATQLREDSNVRGWLLTVARREFLSFRRAQALDLSRLLTLGLAREDDRSSVDDEELSSLGAALDRLGDADRELLLLSAGSGLDSEAVAQALGISATALRQRLARARRRLTQLMSDLEHTPQRAVPAQPKGTR